MAITILGALFKRRETGEGHRLQVAMQDAMGADDVCLFFLADLHALSQPVVASEVGVSLMEPLLSLSTSIAMAPSPVTFVAVPNESIAM